MGKQFTEICLYMTIDRLSEEEANALKGFLENKSSGLFANIEAALKKYLQQRGAKRLTPYVEGIRIQ